MSAPILIASDLTSRSDRAVARACMIGGPSILVHVVDGAAPIQEATRARLHDIASGYLMNPEQVSEVLIVDGRVPDAIARVSAERGCRLIAAGIASFDSPKDYILGTTIDFLVRRASVPVLIVKRRPKVPYRTMVAATDFSQCLRRALEIAAQLFPESRIKLLHACSPPFPKRLDTAEKVLFLRREREEQMRELLELLPSAVSERVEPEILTGSLEGALEEHRVAGRCDLLILGTHGRSGFDHAMFGGRASELLTSSLADVLMVREI